MEQQDTKTTECCICYNKLACKSYCFCYNQSIHRVCQPCYKQMKVQQCPICRGSENKIVKKNIYDIRLLRVEPILQLNRVFIFIDRINSVSTFTYDEVISFPHIDFQLIGDCHIQLYCESKKLYAKYTVNQDYILRYICNQLRKEISQYHNTDSLQQLINSDDKTQLKKILQFQFIIDGQNMHLQIRLNNIIGSVVFQKNTVDNLFLNGKSSIPSQQDMKQLQNAIISDCIMTNYVIQRTLQLQIKIIDTDDRDKYTIQERFQERCKLFLQ